MTQYYITYKSKDDIFYLEGITFFNKVKWGTDIDKVRLYNEYPRPFIINTIIKQTNIDTDIIDMKKQNIFIHKIKVVEHDELTTINLKQKWL